MATRIVIDPATRLEGHLKVEVQTEGGRVFSARSSGMLYRGFENILVGKDPRDAAHVTQRVCGVCPTPHAMAACLALEAAAGQHVPENARIVRNLILGADLLQSHILHFYHLALLSYIRGPAMAPWAPMDEVDLRFDAAQNQQLVDHYLSALTTRRQAHEIGAILGGRLPHSVAYEYGGVTVVPTAQQISSFRDLLDTIIAFIDDVYLPDVNLLAERYADYYEIGRGYGHLLAFGVYDLNADGSTKLQPRGRVVDGSTHVQGVDMGSILEQAAYSWYSDATSGRNPSQGETEPEAMKEKGYSWLKAPRYEGQPYETGPLARMWVGGHYRRGISAMDRHQARAQEARLVAYAMRDWLAQLNLGQAFYTLLPRLQNGIGIGLTEAARGALGHWVQVSNGAVALYQIITPTCWNCSPRDDAGAAGPLEKALEGVAVTDGAHPVEVLRVVHSYDPCLACAVH